MALAKRLPKSTAKVNVYKLCLSNYIADDFTAEIRTLLISPYQQQTIQSYRTSIETSSDKETDSRSISDYLDQFSAQAWKMKKIHSEKISSEIIFSKKNFFSYIREMEFSAPKIKKFPIFSQKKLFLYFGKMELSSSKLKKLLFFFWKKNIYIYIYISETLMEEC